MDALLSIFDKACDPCPTLFPDEIERKIQLRRNQKFLTMQLTIVSLFFIYVIFLKENPNFTDYWFLCMFILNTTVFCLIARSHPTLFKVFYGSIITLAGPTVLYLHKDGVFGCWSTVYFIPMLLLYFSGCKIMYVIQVAIQLFYMDSYYKGKMIETLNERTSHAFVQDLMSCQMFAIVFSSVVVYSIGVSLVETFKQDIIFGESQRKELEVQKTFILSFSHEIRNLINTLTGNIQLSLLEKVPPKVKGYLEDAEIGAGLLIQLINNILDTGNLEVGELEINRSNQMIHSTLEKVWRMCGYLLKAKNLKGQLRILKGLPHHLKLDHERFMQILINLIVNAVKFTDKGSVDIKLEWIPKADKVTDKCFLPCPFDDIDEGLFEKDQAFSLLNSDFTIVNLHKRKWRSDQYCDSIEACQGILKVSVTDTGFGISPRNLRKVFDRFPSHIFGDQTMINKLGTTIGLYVTKELCNKMEGDIKIFSKLGKGTSFIACIPAEQILPNKLLQTNSMILSSSDCLPEDMKPKAMIVDDLNFNIVVLTSYLQRMNIEVTNTAVDGLDAYTKYVESVKMGYKFDIVTMDVEMPVMDGKKAARKIREYERNNNLEPCFLIMISGNVCESEISKCMRHDGHMLANYFLKKPAIYEDIFRVINEQFSIASQSTIPSLF